MSNGTTAATVERILEGWPARLEEADVAALDGLSAEQASDLSGRMMAVLPAGPLGATEAARLGRLMTVVRALSITPDPLSVAAMRERYERTERMPDTVMRMLDELERLASTSPGVLGGGPVPTRDPLPRRGGRPGGLRPTGGPAVQPTAPPPPPQIGIEVQPAPPPPPVDVDAEGGFEAVEANGEPADAPPADDGRFLRAEFEDHDTSEPLTKGEQVTVAFDVGLEETPLAGPLPPGLFVGREDETLELTVQLNSPDFEILGDASRPLRLDSTGPSKGKARFDISPLRDGQCQLTATLHFQGNFLTQMRLTVPVGQPGTFSFEIIGRPVDAAVVLEPRDLSLVIRPEGAGYTCIALGSVGFEAPLPLSADDLAAAANAARKELTEVVKGVHGGRQTFLESIDIPADVQQQALGQLARAGRRLFQQLFQSAGAGGDARSIGDWLVEHATDPELQLTLQIFAARVPIPWSMLYLGDAREGAELDWNHFLGFRHIIEQLPFQRLPGTKSNFIESEPDLSVSLNINPTIDEEMRINLVANHRERWTQIASTRRNLAIVPPGDSCRSPFRPRRRHQQ